MSVRAPWESCRALSACWLLQGHCLIYSLSSCGIIPIAFVPVRIGNLNAGEEGEE